MYRDTPDFPTQTFLIILLIQSQPQINKKYLRIIPINSIDYKEEKNHDDLEFYSKQMCKDDGGGGGSNSGGSGGGEYDDDDHGDDHDHASPRMVCLAHHNHYGLFTLGKPHSPLMKARFS